MPHLDVSVTLPRYIAGVKFSTVLLFSLLVVFARAQEVKGPVARSLGGASLSIANPWSVFNNQASMAQIEHFGVAVSTARMYNIDQLSQTAIGLVVPVQKAGTIGISYSNSGVRGLYSVKEMGLSLARSFGDVLSMGLELTTRNLFIENYGNQWLLTPELGILLRPEKNLSLAAHISNPFGAFVSESINERFPTIVRFGGNYQINEDISVLAEMSAYSTQKSKFHGGLLYQLNPKVTLSTGFQTRDFSSSFGLQLALSKVRIHLALSYHQKLGSSPEFGLQYGAI